MMFFCMCCGQAKKQTQKQISQSSTQLLNTGVKHFRGRVPPTRRMKWTCTDLLPLMLLMSFFFFFFLILFFCCRWFCSASESYCWFLFVFWFWFFVTLKNILHPSWWESLSGSSAADALATLGWFWQTHSSCFKAMLTKKLKPALLDLARLLVHDVLLTCSPAALLAGCSLLLVLYFKLWLSLDPGIFWGMEVGEILHSLPTPTVQHATTV